jgi:predicted dehydrogenase
MKKSSDQQTLSRRHFLRRSTLAAGAFLIVPRYVLGGPGYTAPSDKINLGMIGCGRQSGGLGRRFMELDEVQMVAACDVFDAKRQRFLQQVNAHYAEGTGKPGYDGCAAYHNYEDLIAHDDLDGVIVVTPDHWHALISIDAMKAGKDVYVEKPLAHTVREGRAMVQAARKYGRVVQTGSMQRSWENFRKACELVRNGYIGELKTVLVNVGDPAVPYDLPEEEMPAGLDWDRWLGPAPVLPFNNALAPAIPETFWPKWREYREFGGGILSDWGAHMFDIAQWGLGMDDSGPVELIPPEDRSAKRGLKLIYASGIEMRHEDFDRGWAVRFIGSEGSIDISRQFFESNPASLVEKELSSSDARLYHSDNHYQDWLDAMKSRQRPICDVEVGHRSSTVCNIANIAYQLGRPLQWDPEREKFKGDRAANKLLGRDYRKPYKVKGA